MSQLDDAVKSVKERFLERKGRVNQLEWTIRDLQKKLAVDKAAHAAGLQQIEILTKSIEAMKAAIVPLTEQGMGRLKELVEYGLKTIFFDRDYGVEVEVDDRGHEKTAEFWLLEPDEETGLMKRVRMRDSVGGGVLTVVSIVLKVFFILHYRERRFLALDEPFTDLNEKYLPPMFEFLQRMIADLGFRILMVTQDPRFKEYADRLYEVKDGTAVLRKAV